MKQIILGTAGHIDHGKTSLIKKITGTDTDRLKEEKLRGITIELGFALLKLPGGQHLGIVDVPGHEKFVKNMVAGATGIDIVVMVIAADEGVMPQTREHMEICSLLGIQHGFVALTKTDMVDEEWMELALDDVREFTEGTFLEDQPIIPVSSVSGEGIPELLDTLDQLTSKIPDHPPSGLFRLPVDRVFTMKGFGTVITGSLVSGHVNTGDTIVIYPSMVTSKIRGIQVHNQSTDTAEAGQRTAINFQGLEKTSINRGEVLAFPDTLKPSFMVDVSFKYLESNKKPLKYRTQVRFHTGTSEVLGYLILLDRDELNPGDTVAAQLRFDTPVIVVRDDRFVIRSCSPVRTIGGGQILNPVPKKHKRFNEETNKGLQGILDLGPEDLGSYYISEAGLNGVSLRDLLIMTNLPAKKLDNYLQTLLSKKIIIQLDKENKIYIHSINFNQLVINFLESLKNYHEINPLKAGMPKEELKTRILANLNPKLFTLVINQTTKSNEIIVEEDTVRLATHTVSLQANQTDIKNTIIETYKEAKLQPPYFRELNKNLDIDDSQAKEVLMLLVEEGLIIKVKEDLFFDTEAVEELKSRLVDFLSKKDEITTPQFKEMTGASRKYAIPLIEYFDSNKVTLRIGDIRKLRGG